MKRVLLGSLVAFAVACGACKSDKAADRGDEPVEPATDETTPSSAADVVEQTEEGLAEESEEAVVPPAEASAAAIETSVAGIEAKVSLPGKILLPPAEPGTANAQLAGCIAVAEPSEADAAKFPEKVATRSGPAKPAFVVVPTGGGIVVEHQVSHACCLKGTVKTEAEHNRVVVNEVMSGTPCRCRCSSTFRTAVAVPAGEWTVLLNTVVNGKVQLVGQQAVTVQ